MSSDSFTIIQQHISSATQCPREETKYFLRERKFMRVVTVGIGILIFYVWMSPMWLKRHVDCWFLLVYFVLELKTWNIAKGVITPLYSWLFPNIYTTSILCEACMASAPLEMERFVVWNSKEHICQLFRIFHHIITLTLLAWSSSKLRLCFINIDVRVLLRASTTPQTVLAELLSWSHLQLKAAHEVLITSFQ